MARALRAASERFSPNLAVADESESLTYHEFAARANRLADALRGLQLPADEPVIVRVANRAADLVAFQAVWLAGGVVVPVHRDAPTAVLDDVVSSVASGFIVDGDSTERLAQPQVASRPLLRDAALVVLTSGSTGKPKGVILSHEAFAGKLEAIQSCLAFGPATRTLLVLQITFSFGIWVSLLTMREGGRLTMRRKFTPSEVRQTLSNLEISDVAFVPTMLRSLLAEVSEPPLPPCPCIRRLLTGGEPLGPTLGSEIRMLFPQADIVDVYGLTETCTSDFMAASDPRSDSAGAIGRPTPGVEFRIVDASGRPAGSGESGELQIKTPFIMNGYLDAPDLTAAAFDGPYLRTGDLARLRADGMVELVGRAKELISRGGNKIAPLELDQVLTRHPDIVAALTTGVPDPILGERIHALILTRPGARLDEETVRAWTNERVDRFKRPDVYHFARELPLGRTGKVDRGQLRELILRGAMFSVSG